ncbi:hypothetical protein OSTOST_00410 [Ostertagia ostertagi]
MRLPLTWWMDSIEFEKLCQAASKYERHVHYQDVHYLTVDCDGKEELLEFTDPGLLPLRLLCDSDEIVEDEEDGGSTGISSVSEGYESDPEREGRMRRRNSMEKIRKAHEDGGMAVEQGQQWANELGPDCEFMMLSSSQFTDAKTFLEGIVSTIRSHRKTRARTLITRLKPRNKLSPRKTDASSKDGRLCSKSRASSKSSSTESNSGEKLDNKSKVCSIM